MTVYKTIIAFYSNIFFKTISEPVDALIIAPPSLKRTPKHTHTTHPDHASKPFEMISIFVIVLT